MINTVITITLAILILILILILLIDSPYMNTVVSLCISRFFELQWELLNLLLIIIRWFGIDILAYTLLLALIIGSCFLAFTFTLVGGLDQASSRLFRYLFSIRFTPLSIIVQNGFLPFSANSPYKFIQDLLKIKIEKCLITKLAIAYPIVYGALVANDFVLNSNLVDLCTFAVYAFIISKVCTDMRLYSEPAPSLPHSRPNLALYFWYRSPLYGYAATALFFNTQVLFAVGAIPNTIHALLNATMLILNAVCYINCVYGVHLAQDTCKSFILRTYQFVWSILFCGHLHYVCAINIPLLLIVYATYLVNHNARAAITRGLLGATVGTLSTVRVSCKYDKPTTDKSYRWGGMSMPQANAVLTEHALALTTDLPSFGITGFLGGYINNSELNKGIYGTIIAIQSFCRTSIKNSRNHSD